MATDRTRPARRRRVILGGGVVLAVIVVVAVVVGSLHAGAVRPRGSSGTVPTTASSNSSSPHANKPVGALRVVTVSPVNGATNVAYDADIEVTFSHALRPDSRFPTLNPPLAGRWTRPSATTLRFVPSAPLVPDSTEHLVIPEGTGKPRATNGARLAAPFTANFSVVSGTILRIQQMLAELGYLPYSFVPSGAGAAATPAASALTSEGASAGTVSRQARPGTFTPRFAGIPSQLAAGFTAGEFNVVTTGAIMRFQDDHNLTVNGEVTAQLWSALFDAVASRDATTQPYDYLIVSETDPETLYVWRDGKVIYQTAANTGAEGAATELGTFPVYERFVSATMTGTNPDGSHYTDPGIPWIAYFNGNDAVHGFVRAGYGYPQSDGCVELPPANAAVVFPTDPLGTLVTVTTGDLSPELHAAPPSFISPPAAPSTSTSTTTTTTTTTVPAQPRPAPTTTSTLPPTTVPPTTVPPTTVPPTTVPPESTTTTLPSASGPTG